MVPTKRSDALVPDTTIAREITMSLLLFPLMTIAGAFLGREISYYAASSIFLHVAILSAFVVLALENGLYTIYGFAPVKIFGLCMLVWNFTLSMTAANLLTWFFS